MDFSWFSDSIFISLSKLSSSLPLLLGFPRLLDFPRCDERPLRMDILALDVRTDVRYRPCDVSEATTREMVALIFSPSRAPGLPMRFNFVILAGQGSGACPGMRPIHLRCPSRLIHQDSSAGRWPDVLDTQKQPKSAGRKLGG